MWTRKSWVGWVWLASLALLAPLVGCRFGREYHSDAGGCCGKKSPGGERVHAPAAPGSTTEGLYGGQRTCPVTGETLGNMGPPIPVTLKGQTVYVCCKACVANVQRAPDAYLRKVQAERPSQSGGPPPASGSLPAPATGGCCRGG